MTKVLQGKVAIVTGAGRGLGRAHALTLAAAGAQVVVNDFGGGTDGSGNDDTLAAQVVREIIAAGGNAVASTHDVSNWDETKGIVDLAINTFGDIDILVNNAGVIHLGTIDTTTKENWERVVAVNLNGSAALAHHVSAHWRKTGPKSGRAIVNTASPGGTFPGPYGGSYCAAKAGVSAVTITWAIELAELGARVNAIAPMAQTRMTDLMPAMDDIMRTNQNGFNRFAPENVSQVVLYLVSPSNRFTARTFGTEGDNVYLFNGWSAVDKVSADLKNWTLDTLSEGLSSIDVQDHAYMIAPLTYEIAAVPPSTVIDALDAFAKDK